MVNIGFDKIICNNKLSNGSSFENMVIKYYFQVYNKIRSVCFLNKLCLKLLQILRKSWTWIICVHCHNSCTYKEHLQAFSYLYLRYFLGKVQLMSKYKFQCILNVTLLCKHFYNKLESPFEQKRIPWTHRLFLYLHMLPRSIEEYIPWKCYFEVQLFFNIQRSKKALSYRYC